MNKGQIRWKVERDFRKAVRTGSDRDMYTKDHKKAIIK